MADNDNINRGVTSVDIIRALGANPAFNPQLSIAKSLLASPGHLNIIPHLPRPIANQNDPMKFGDGQNVMNNNDASALWAIDRIGNKFMPNYTPGMVTGQPRESTNVEDQRNRGPYMSSIDEILAQLRSGKNPQDINLPTDMPVSPISGR